MKALASRIARCAAPPGSPFVLDTRAIGLFRVLLALTILWDQAIRLDDWHAFHSALGVVSLADSRTWDSSWIWSLYWLSDGPWLPYVLEALRGLATLTLLFGIRSRLSAFLLFVLLASTVARNPLILQGGDKVLVVMTFFACFLPLGACCSLERLWFGGKPDSACRSAGTAAYAVQVLLVWFMGGILKTGEQWWGSGTALSMALHLEVFVTEFARFWRGWDWLVQPLTFFVFWIECLAPLLVLLPSYWSRVAGLLALIALEAGIWLSVEVGLFPLISVVSLIPLVPPRSVDWVARWRAGRVGPGGPRLVLFYDRDCRFCAFACRLLLAVCGIRGASLREAQSDPAAARVLDERFSWSVTRALNSGNEAACAELDPDYRQGWEAVRFLASCSRRTWLLHLLPDVTRGEALYGAIGRNRGALGLAGGVVFGRTAPAGIGPVGRFTAAGALAIVLAWNLATYPAVRERNDLRPLVEPVIGLLNLTQYWDMFAPYPYASDFWHAMPALARDGRRLDLLSGLPVTLDTPVDGPDRYGGYRWRKSILRSRERGEMDRVFRYFCLRGAWAAIDLWEFSRPNPGTSETVDRPYAVYRAGRWHCDDVDLAAVDGFRAGIDRMMEEYRRAGDSG